MEKNNIYNVFNELICKSNTYKNYYGKLININNKETKVSRALIKEIIMLDAKIRQILKDNPEING